MKTRKIYRLANTLTRIKLLSLIRRFSGYFSNNIPILAYHRVIDTDANYPFDCSLVSADREQFQRQMEYVKQHYQALSLNDYIKHINGVKSAPKNAILITFDDGFEDNFSNAFPILKSLGLPATFFVTTDFITSDDVIWYERLAFFIKTTELKSIEIEELGLSYKLPNDLNSRQAIYESVVEQFKNIPNNLREHLQQQLYSSDKTFTQRLMASKSLSLGMTWEQLREMSAAGMDVGSHSVSHPVLSQLSAAEIKAELATSKQKIEEELKRDVASVAYPVGQKESFNKQVETLARELKYQVGFTYIDGIARGNPFAIERLHVETLEPHSYFQAKLAMPFLFCD